MNDSETTTSRRGRPRPMIIGGVLVALAVVIGLLFAGRAVDSSEPGSVRARTGVTEFAAAERKAPIAISGTTLDGEALDLAGLRGKPVVLNVWGSWCAPCRKEAPALAAVAADFKGRVQFVGINVQDNVASARAFERAFGIKYPSLNDSGGSSLLALRDTVPPKAVPSTIVLDRQGRVAARIIGAVRETTLRALVATVVAEPASR